MVIHNLQREARSLEQKSQGRRHSFKYIYVYFLKQRERQKTPEYLEGAAVSVEILQVCQLNVQVTLHIHFQSALNATARYGGREGQKKKIIHE